MPSNDTTVYPVIYILGRNNYDNFGEENYGDNIFFVRENSGEESGMVSLYVGESKQTDILDLSNDDNVEFDPATNTYNIPEKYRVKGKVFLAAKDLGNNKIQYSAYLWDGTSFRECGIPNNVQLVNVNNDWNPTDPSVISAGIKDFMYLDATRKIIYTFDGTEYVATLTIPDTSTFATISYVDTNFVAKSDMPSNYVDNITTTVASGKIKAGINLSTGQLATTSGNAISSTDVPLATVVKQDSTAAGSYTEAYLPRNGGEWRITSQISQLNISNISTMRTSDNSTTARTDDYLSVVIFKKASSLTDVSDVMGNFALTNANKIYLMNPDVDISSYTVIHLLLYYDGFNMCAIVTGYQEISQP